MIVVTRHALRHFTGRCRRRVPAPFDSTPTAAHRYLRGVVEDGRIASRLEALCVSLWVGRARHWASVAGRAWSAGDVVVADELDVALRFGRGLPGSKYRTREAAGN
jgi:hypothetical protein